MEESLYRIPSRNSFFSRPPMWCAPKGTHRRRCINVTSRGLLQVNFFTSKRNTLIVSHLEYSCLVSILPRSSWISTAVSCPSRGEIARRATVFIAQASRERPPIRELPAFDKFRRKLVPWPSGFAGGMARLRVVGQHICHSSYSFTAFGLAKSSTPHSINPLAKSQYP